MSRRLAERSIVVATHNPGKLREMRDLLAPFGIAVASAGELGLPEPAETGKSFEENSLLKASSAAGSARRPALADDSGLAVEALGGEPGIHSARWAGPARDFESAMERIESLLRERKAESPDARRARFVSVLAVAWPDGHCETFEGVVEGRLVWPPRGTGGFGYDPIFVPEGHDRTFGEMTAEEKHGLSAHPLSHRARAFRRFADACLVRAA